MKEREIDRKNVGCFVARTGKATNFVVRGGRGEVRKGGRRRKKERWRRVLGRVTKFGEGAR